MSNTLKIGDVEVGGRAWIAPMTGVSDLPFRKAASKLGATYVATEMVACAEFSKGRPDVVRRAAVGAVANAVLQKPLGQAASKNYRVTGPWKDPKVEVVERPPASASSSTAARGAQR